MTWFSTHLFVFVFQIDIHYLQFTPNVKIKHWKFEGKYSKIDKMELLWNLYFLVYFGPPCVNVTSLFSRFDRKTKCWWRPTKKKRPTSLYIFLYIGNKNKYIDVPYKIRWDFLKFNTFNTSNILNSVGKIHIAKKKISNKPTLFLSCCRLIFSCLLHSQSRF